MVSDEHRAPFFAYICKIWDRDILKQATSHAQIIRPQSPKTRVRDFAASDVGNDKWLRWAEQDWAEFVAPLAA